MEVIGEEKLLQKGCVLKLVITYPGNTAKVPPGKIEEKGRGEGPVIVDSTKSLVKVTTNKYVSKTYKEIEQFAKKTRKNIKDMGHPYYGHEGEYILPLKKLGEALELLKKKKEEWDIKVEQFLEEWGDIKDASLLQLKALGDNKNYPPKAAIREKFSWFYTVKSLAADFAVDNLQELDESAYRQTVSIMKENLQGTLSLLGDSITSGMIEILESLSKSLEEGGKLHKKSFDKGMEMCKFLLEGGGNMLENANLTQVANDFKKLISGDSAGIVKACKDSQGVKETVKAALSNFHATLLASMNNERKYEL